MDSGTSPKNDDKYKVKLLLKHNTSISLRLCSKDGLRSEFPNDLRQLLRDPKACIVVEEKDDEDSSDDEDDDEMVPTFQIEQQAFEDVKRHAIQLGYPLVVEYDYQYDKVNPSNIPMYLKPNAHIRPYQEQSLNKMLGNGRARSGIIALPCGAGKTLTGITAAQTIKKSVLCLCTFTMSVLQWKDQFQKWTNIPDDRIAVFTSNNRKDKIHPDGCVLLTTYAMMSYSGTRSDKTQQIIETIQSREWGLLLMDEVHVAPADTFRRVVGRVKACCRLGLTATLVREDDLISDLDFLIGPVLYEANWMDLTAQGYLANVQCVEVRCPMVGPFLEEYSTAPNNSKLKQLLYIMNPTKLRTAEFLVRFHEERGDKIILFSDLVFSLKLYSEILKRPFFHGETKEWERQAVLDSFRESNVVNTICLSKVGDASIDLPDANVIIQVSSHFGSRQQEAQRLGRILRPKSVKAYFYTLVSNETEEIVYSGKRQQYLMEQGYTFQIVTNLCEQADKEAVEHNYSYSTPEDDRTLLRKLLTSGSDLQKMERAQKRASRQDHGYDA